MKNQLSAIKALFRFRIYTIINIIGLAISVAATLIIVRYIHQEVTVDHFCKDLNQLYILTAQRSNSHISIIDNTDRNNDPNFIDPMKNPEVEKYSYCISFKDDYIIVDDHRFQANVLVTDSFFLQLMDYPVIFQALRLFNVRMMRSLPENMLNIFLRMKTRLESNLFLPQAIHLLYGEL